MEEATRLYGPDVRVFTTAAHEWAAVFPTHNLFSVVKLSRHPAPTFHMAFDSVLHRGWDVTTQWPLLVPDGQPTTAANAILHARAYAEAANTQLQPHRHVVGFADAATLGHGVADPVATATPGGWRVVLSTWSDENGVVAKWTVDTTTSTITKATWEITALRAGTFDRHWEGVPFDVGFLFENTYGATYTLRGWRPIGGALTELTLLDAALNLAFLPVATATNFDGSTWVASYPGAATPAVTALAEDALAAATWSYSGMVGENSGPGPCAGIQNPNASWGFHSRDADCTLRIRILPQTAVACGACVLSGNETAIYVAEDFHEWLAGRVGWYRNASAYVARETLRLAIAHSHLVSLTSRAPGQLPDIERADPSDGFLREDHTVDPEAFAMKAILDPAFHRLTRELDTEAGFLDVSPLLDGSPGIVLVGDGFVVQAATLDTLPVGWEISVSNRTQARPPFLAFESPPVLTEVDPANGTDPIGPGSRIIIGLNACTAAFIWRLESSYLIETAGHCLLPESSVTVADIPGYSYVNPERLTASICIRSCAAGDPRFAVWCTNPEVPEVCRQNILGEFAPLGAVLYARFDDGYSGKNDVAFIAVPENLTHLLSAAVPVWGGPARAGCANSWLAGEFKLQQLALFYGNGALWGTTPVARACAGLMTQCEEHWSAALPISAGDSGGGVLRAEADPSGKLAAKSAVGVVSATTGAAGIAFGVHVRGTAMERAKALVLDDLGLEMTPVCEGGIECPWA